EAVPLLREGVAGCDRIGSGILHTFFLGELAEACWRVGDRAGAWEALDRGQAHNDRLGQRVFEAELRRRRAMFLLDESADNAAAAASCGSLPTRSSPRATSSSPAASSPVASATAPPGTWTTP